MCKLGTYTEIGTGSILALHDRRDKGQIPNFDRIVIETTGLADPTPIVSTLMLENIITTVDAINAKQHLSDNPETANKLYWLIAF
ncbi:MAG: hypothetical protein COA78_16860 [Blastopirellula sp.]|nr:MAG: hypothetical protein COA78_16860 [Blastopirellula sp.]